MQKKHLIAFTLATIFILLGFNMINNYFHEKKRAELASSDTPVVTESGNKINNSVVEQPLGKQPKAIIDNVTTQIDQAQRVEADNLKQIDDAP